MLAPQHRDRVLAQFGKSFVVGFDDELVDLCTGARFEPQPFLGEIEASEGVGDDRYVDVVWRRAGDAVDAIGP